MNPNLKKIVYGSVLAGSFALLVPQLLDSGKAPSRPAPLELAADGVPLQQVPPPSNSQPSLAGFGVPDAAAAAATEPVVEDGVDEGIASAPDAAHAAPLAGVQAPNASNPVASAAAAGGSLDRLREALAKLDAVDQNESIVRPNAGRRNRVARREPSDEAATEPTKPLPLELAPLRRDDESTDALNDYLAKQPLCGLIRGEHDSAAMFGGRVVRVGDRLTPGGARVTRFDARGVIVDLDGREVCVELPSIQPRAKVKSGDLGDGSDGVKPDGGDGTSSDGGGSSAPSLGGAGKTDLESVVEALGKQESPQ